MPKETLRVGIIARSWPPASRWAQRALRPFAVLADLPDLAPGSLMSDIDGVRTVYMGDHALTLHSGETGHYLTNLAAARPSVWVSMVGDAVHLVTPDPHEGESLAGDPERLTEALEMPLPLRAAVADFVALHHVEEVFVKRKRKPASIESQADPRAPRILPLDEKWGRR